MTEIMLEATDIRKVLGDDAGRLEVLKGINLSLGGGELTLLMGPSGSGKTTLLSVLGCMLNSNQRRRSNSWPLDDRAGVGGIG